MNFKTIAQNGETITKMEGMLKSKGKYGNNERQQYNITDSAGNAREVMIFAGKGGLPPDEAIGQNCSFSLRCKPYKGQPSYSGYFNKALSPPQKQPAQKDVSQTSFAISYAKDLVVAGKIDLKDMYREAAKMHEYMATGKEPFGLPPYDGKTEDDLPPPEDNSNPDYDPNYEQPKDDVPF